MTRGDRSGPSGGIGFFGLLTVLFIGLKLTHVIAWSWWLVLLPCYGSLLAALVIVGLVLVFAHAWHGVPPRTPRR